MTTRPEGALPVSEMEDPYLQDMTYDECMAHLAQHRVGRVAIIVRHYPQVFPVNYMLDGFVVVFRTHLGRNLLAANHANVCFEIDELDDGTHSGWSVLVQGMAEDVTDRLHDLNTDLARQLPIEPWAPGFKPRTVRIIPAHVTGRVLHPGGRLFATDASGYL